MTTERYPQLQQFLGGYFHEDFPLETPRWQDAVALFVKQATRDAVLAVYDDLTALRLETPDDEMLDQALFELGSCYAPEGDGMTSSEWVQAIQKQLAQSLPGRTSD